jgi:chemotaxis signal transduction protein
VVVTAYGKAVFGLLVDAVVGVVPVLPSRVEMPPGGTVGSDFLKGVVHYHSSRGKNDTQRLLILLKPDRVLQP